MVKTLAIFVLLLVVSSTSFSQYPLTSKREEIKLSTNTQTVFVGERLHFSAYCLDSRTGKFTDLSKYAYVQLIGEDGEVYRKKLLLNNGVGAGDFFIGSDLPTGHYYLVGYTRWMRNEDDFTQIPIRLINPFENYDSGVEDSLKLEVISLGGPFVQGLENQAALRLMNVQEGASYEVRLVSDSGELLTRINDVSIDPKVFSFTPLSGKNYRLVVRDNSGKVSFFDFPEIAQEGSRLNIESLNDRLNISWASTYDKGQKQVLVSRRDSVVKRISVADNQKVTLNRSDLGSGLFQIQAYDIRGYMSQYSFSNTKLSRQKSNQNFNTRSVANLNQTLEKGNYNVSIRRTSEINNGSNYLILNPLTLDLNASISNAEYDALMAFSSKQEGFIDDGNLLKYSPEFRGEILVGNISSSDSSGLEGKTVTLSINNSPMNLSAALVQSDGSFLMEYNSVENQMNNASLLVHDPTRDYEISVVDNFRTVFPEFLFPRLKLDSADIEEIEARSFNAQVRNAFYNEPVPQPSFERNIPVIRPDDFAIRYLFDDYTRFRTLKEHFVEYIVGARVRNNENNPFLLNPVFLELRFEFRPLVLLDEVPVDATELLKFSPYRIKSLEILNNSFFIQDAFFDGVLSFTTFDGNLGGFELSKNNLDFGLNGSYSIEKGLNATKPSSGKLPDLREQLAWIPGLRVDISGNQIIEFYTSDLEGDFELKIEGITDRGEVVSIVKSFTVKSANNE